MPNPRQSVEHSGRVTLQFGHRYVVETDVGHVLIDLGPHGALQVPLSVGDSVALAGVEKPSEIKVRRIQVNDGPAVLLESKHDAKHGPKHGLKHGPKDGPKHGPKHPAEHDATEADPQIALDAVRSAGFEVLAQPRRKPRHFEILGRRDGTEPQELHIEFDGRIRKQRPGDPADHKWHPTGL